MHDQMPRNAFSEQLFEYRAVEKRKLLLSLTITAAVMVVEVIGGVLANSIALISDAGHMFTHAFAISIIESTIRVAAEEEHEVCNIPLATLDPLSRLKPRAR
jgi:Co/Zn/Cd efflux system component